MKIPQNTGKKREKKYFGISRFSLERVIFSHEVTFPCILKETTFRFLEHERARRESKIGR